MLGCAMNRQGKSLDAIEEESSLPTRLFRGTSWSTGVRMCRGDSSVEDWWTMCVQSAPPGVQWTK